MAGRMLRLGSRRQSVAMQKDWKDRATLLKAVQMLQTGFTYRIHFKMKKTYRLFKCN